MKNKNPDYYAGKRARRVIQLNNDNLDIIK